MNKHVNDKLDNELTNIKMKKKKLIKLNFCTVLLKN